MKHSRADQALHFVLEIVLIACDVELNLNRK